MTCPQCDQPKRWCASLSNPGGQWLCVPCKYRRALNRQLEVSVDKRPPGASPCHKEIRDYWATVPRKEVRT